MNAPRVSIPRVRIKGTQIYADAFNSALGGNTGAGLAYDASGTGRRATNWKVSSTGPKSSLTHALPTLRNRARDALRKNAYAESAVATLQSNIVGSGILPQFKTPSVELNKQLAELFEDWTEEADADGRCDFVGLQALTARAVVEGGEVFERFRVRRRADMQTVPLQLQLLEPEYCPTNQDKLVPGREVTNGIEFNLIGQRTAYWMFARHPQDQTFQRQIADSSTRPIPASEISHIYSSRRPGDIRGEPWLTRGLIKLFDVDAYDDAEVLRKKTAALVAGFITTPEAEGFGGEAPDADGVATATWEPGAMVNLAPGEEVTFSQPTEVGSTYEAFNRQQLRAIAVSAGVLYEQMTGDYSKINDRTFRASVNEFRRRIEMVQRNLIVFQFCRPTIRRWLATAVVAELIEVPASFGPRDLFRVEWMLPGWSYIHPVQEVDADLKAVRGGLKSRTAVIAERGGDAKEVDRQIAEDNERADGFGNTYDSDPRKTSGAGMAQGDAETGDGKEDSDDDAPVEAGDEPVEADEPAEEEEDERELEDA